MRFEVGTGVWVDFGVIVLYLFVCLFFFVVCHNVYHLLILFFCLYYFKTLNNHIIIVQTVNMKSGFVCHYIILCTHIIIVILQQQRTHSITTLVQLRSDI